MLDNYTHCKDPLPDQNFISAINTYNPIHILFLFSGGHDSLCSTHYGISLMKIKGINIPFSVYHGDTGIGIPETQEFVKNVCNNYGWDLIIRKPEGRNTYESFVKRFGFPGPSMHPYMYRNLKEKPLRKFITHELKSSPYARENVLLVTGIRSSESIIRMGYKESVKKDGSRIWGSPIMDWGEKDCEDWMKVHSLPRNPVKDKICISGECLCGCFAKPEEPAELKTNYPQAWEKIDRLSKYSEWGWGKDPSKWRKHNPPNQLKIDFMPMCIGCEAKK